MTLQEKQEDIIDEFSMFDDWMQKYEYMIDLGKTLPLIDASLKSDEKLIKGCQSKVWLHSQVEDGKVIFTADSGRYYHQGYRRYLDSGVF